mmetsp:Transcript_32363/g.65978  ORF Transcript_32363/g.65978 Transcript_32363/m.65978 type:complete len:201 (+) Transcript_32363:498-1100(+)
MVVLPSFFLLKVLTPDSVLSFLAPLWSLSASSLNVMVTYFFFRLSQWCTFCCAYCALVSSAVKSSMPSSSRPATTASIPLPPCSPMMPLEGSNASSCAFASASVACPYPMKNAGSRNAPEPKPPPLPPSLSRGCMPLRSCSCSCCCSCKEEDEESSGFSTAPPPVLLARFFLSALDKRRFPAPAAVSDASDDDDGFLSDL